MIPMCSDARPPARAAQLMWYGHHCVSTVPLAVHMAHEVHMQRALQLARRYRGFTSPNPCVGAVIVRDGEVVGQGGHREAGQPHAEVEALREAGDQAHGATLYCTLEPCNHQGRTPPCSTAIVEAGIGRVVFASRDPNPDVKGNGAQALKNAGIDVIPGVLEAEANYLNREFLHACRFSRPWVVLKTAISLDGKVATSAGESQWITSESSREHAHRLRHEVDAIVVGAGTVAADNPRLNVRLPGGPWSQPVRVVMDSRARSHPRAQVFDPATGGSSMLATTSSPTPEALAAFEMMGVDVLRVDTDPEGRVSPLAMLEMLADRGMQSVLIEGGPTVAGSFLEADLVDEVIAYLSPSLIGGSEAKGAIAGSGRATLDDRLWLDRVTTERCGEDIMIRGLTRRMKEDTR